MYIDSMVNYPYVLMFRGDTYPRALPIHGSIAPV